MNAACLLGPENDCDFCGSCEPINTFLVRTQRFLSLLSQNVTDDDDDDEASLNLDSTKNGLMEEGLVICPAANHEGIIKVFFLNSDVFHVTSGQTRLESETRHSGAFFKYCIFIITSLQLSRGHSSHRWTVTFYQFTDYDKLPRRRAEI